MFSKALCFRVVKTWNCLVKGELFTTQSQLLTTSKELFENTVGRGEIAVFFPLYTPVEDGTYYGITRGGRAVGIPILCPLHICKTMLAIVMKFHGWIDLIKAECNAQES